LHKRAPTTTAALITEEASPSVVEERATRLLRHAAYAPLTALRCDFHDGVLTVRGRVPSFHLKQIAQVLLRDVEGVGVIDNRVDVDLVDFLPR
jgi:hypothetical protein